MPRPQDFTPASDAIYAALTSVRPWPRTLTTPDLFTRLRTTQEASDVKTKVHQNKRVVVLISSPSMVSTHTNCDRVTYEVEVSITRLYRPGAVQFDGELDASVNRALRDTHLVGQALTMPPALSLSPSGQDTGLDGGALQPSGRASEGPLIDETVGVVRMTDYFTARITLAAVGS